MSKKLLKPERQIPSHLAGFNAPTIGRYIAPNDNDKLRQRRDALYEFVILLTELGDWMMTEFAGHGRTRRLKTPRTIPKKAIGIERLLYRATGEARKVGHHFSGSVWRLLLAVATGEIADLGVIVDGPANKLTERTEASHRNLDKPAEQNYDRVAV